MTLQPAKQLSKMRPLSPVPMESEAFLSSWVGQHAMKPLPDALKPDNPPNMLVARLTVLVPYVVETVVVGTVPDDGGAKPTGSRPPVAAEPFALSSTTPICPCAQVLLATHFGGGIVAVIWWWLVVIFCRQQ